MPPKRTKYLTKFCPSFIGQNFVSYFVRFLGNGVSRKNASENTKNCFQDLLTFSSPCHMSYIPATYEHNFSFIFLVFLNFWFECPSWNFFKKLLFFAGNIHPNATRMVICTSLPCLWSFYHARIYEKKIWKTKNSCSFVSFIFTHLCSYKIIGKFQLKSRNLSKRL